MSERHDNPIDAAALSRGSLLRAAADGELSSAKAAEVGADADSAARIAFEKSLRDAVGRSMKGDAAPAELRARIEAALRAEPDPLPIPLAEKPRAGSAGRRGGVIGWLNDNRSLAALLAVAISLGLFMLWRQGQPTASERIAMDVMAQSLIREGERFAAFGEKFEKQVPYKGRAAAEGAMETVLGAAVPVYDLSSLHYQVAGLASCSLSWPGQSGQLIYHADEGTGWLTLIMNHASAAEAASPVPEKWVSALRSGNPELPPVFLWRKGDVVFYLVAPTEWEGRRALKLFDAPGSVRRFDPDLAWTKGYSGGK